MADGSGVTRTSRRRAGIVLVAMGIIGAGVSTGHAQTPPTVVEQVRLAWVGDSATTMTVRWRAAGESVTTRVRLAATAEWTEVDAVVVPGGSPAAADLEATFVDLAPATEYEYQLAVGGGWTESYQFATTAVTGEPVTAAFVADTGIVGRLDGLTTGTAQVIQAIDDLDPTVVLGGGDYAYFDTDTRFATQSAATDAWLQSMQPVIAERPFMPTYGNHEVQLEERVEEWVARFATPEGDVGRTSYSFDVDGVHFVSLLAYDGPLGPETMTWLAADLEAALQRGARAIIPYMHRNVVGDGTVHAPSSALGLQLTNLFEFYDVDVVFTGHDQSYERSFPLAKGEPTSAARQCYTEVDGITWVKTSPGGKLSNLSLDFSDYSVTPPSSQIAVRENALHHYSTVTVEGTDIEVVTYGVVGDGSPPVVVDRFHYRESCPPELSFTTLPVILDVGEGAATPVDVAVSVSDPAVTWSGDAPWLSVAPGTAAGSATVSVDTAQLSAGTHVASVRAELPGYEPTSLPVVARIGVPAPAGELVTFIGPDRIVGGRLDGSTHSGPVYVGFIPSAPVAGVIFTLDGVELRAEETAPFDAGGGVETASPLSLEDGVHTLDATLTASSGAVSVVSAQFTVGAASNVVPAATTGSTDEAAADAAAAGAASAPAAPGPSPSVALDQAPLVPGPLATLAPPVVGPTTPSGSGSDWWSSLPVLFGAVVFFGLIVGLVARNRLSTNAGHLDRLAG